jgi:hypothetical protein
VYVYTCHVRESAGVFAGHAISFDLLHTGSENAIDPAVGDCACGATGRGARRAVHQRQVDCRIRTSSCPRWVCYCCVTAACVDTISCRSSTIGFRACDRQWIVCLQLALTRRDLLVAFKFTPTSLGRVAVLHCILHRFLVWSHTFPIAGLLTYFHQSISKASIFWRSHISERRSLLLYSKELSSCAAVAMNERDSYELSSCAAVAMNERDSYELSSGAAAAMNERDIAKERKMSFCMLLHCYHTPHCSTRSKRACLGWFR